MTVFWLYQIYNVYSSQISDPVNQEIIRVHNPFSTLVGTDHSFSDKLYLLCLKHFVTAIKNLQALWNANSPLKITPQNGKSIYV